MDNGCNLKYIKPVIFFPPLCCGKWSNLTELVKKKSFSDCTQFAIVELVCAYNLVTGRVIKYLLIHCNACKIGRQTAVAKYLKNADEATWWIGEQLEGPCFLGVLPQSINCGRNKQLYRLYNWQHVSVFYVSFAGFTIVITSLWPYLQKVRLDFTVFFWKNFFVCYSRCRVMQMKVVFAFQRQPEQS